MKWKNVVMGLAFATAVTTPVYANDTITEEHFFTTVVPERNSVMYIVSRNPKEQEDKGKDLEREARRRAEEVARDKVCEKNPDAVRKYDEAERIFRDIKDAIREGQQEGQRRLPGL